MTAHVWASTHGLGSGHFSDYAFVNVDDVYGQNAADQFRIARSTPVPGGHDRCARRTGPAMPRFGF